MSQEEMSLGFAITTGEQSAIEDNFKESFDRPPSEADWEVLREDIEKVEKNALEFLRKKLGGVPLVPYDTVVAVHILERFGEWHPRCNDTETDKALLEGTSDFASALNVGIEFFGVDPKDMERIETII